MTRNAKEALCSDGHTPADEMMADRTDAAEGSTEDRTVFNIPEGNLQSFYHKIALLNRKAAKLGCPQVVTEELGTETTKIDPANYGTITITRHRIKVTGTAPKIAGWEFIGKIEHEAEGNIISSVPGEELPVEYRTAKTICDHCKTTRRRNFTFVVRNEAGEYRQVGRQCLADFLGHLSPQEIASYAQRLYGLTDSLREEEDLWSGGAREKWTVGTEQLLALTACFIETDGWLSRTKANEEGGGQPTADAVVDFILDHDREVTSRRKWYMPEIEVTSKHKADAKAALEWCRTEMWGDDDYTHNLRTLCKLDDVEPRRAGLVCSLIARWRKAVERDRERKAEAENSPSTHQGEVGKRDTWHLELLGINSIESGWGATHIHRMRDEQGNIFVWFASRRPLLDRTYHQKLADGSKVPSTFVVVAEAGEWYQVTGTVKKHDTFKDIAQTVLTRCKFTEVK